MRTDIFVIEAVVAALANVVRNVGIYVSLTAYIGRDV